MTRARHAQKAARRLFRDCVVRSLLDEDRARRVVLHIIEAKRREGPAILSRFCRLVRLDRDRHRADVASATPLPADLRERIASNLARAYGPGVRTSFVEDASLVGGVRIKVGSDVYDDTVQARLAALEARLRSP